MNWHLKKEVSLGHLVSTVLLAIVMVAGWVNLQTRLATLEMHVKTPAHEYSEKRMDAMAAQMVSLSTKNQAMETRLLDLHREILRRLDRQDIKLDRIEDRLNGEKGQ